MLPQSLVAGSPLLVVLTHAVLSIGGGLGGNVLATWTAKVKVAELPAATVPAASEHELPALLSGVHDHPGDEPTGRNEVNCGTVSSRTTPLAPCAPPFETTSLIDQHAPWIRATGDYRLHHA